LLVEACFETSTDKPMARNFHETYSRPSVKPPAERATGLWFALVAVVIAAWWRHAPVVPWVALGAAFALAAVALLAPGALRHPNLIWFRFGLLLHRVVNAVVMFAIFAFVFVPAGLLMRACRNPLGSRRAGPGSSYWIDRKAGAQGPTSMTHQF
jgi:hypothetical protein